jgi:hypothetical protein
MPICHLCGRCLSEYVLTVRPDHVPDLLTTSGTLFRTRHSGRLVGRRRNLAIWGLGPGQLSGRARLFTLAFVLGFSAAGSKPITKNSYPEI